MIRTPAVGTTEQLESEQTSEHSRPGPMGRAVDLQLAGRIDAALRETGYPPLQRVSVGVRAGVVVLQGRLPSYHLKQLAQETALSLDGVVQLVNDVDVCHPRENAATAGRAPASHKDAAAGHE